MSATHPLARISTRMLERVRALADRSPLPMLATRGRAHVVLYMNPAFRQFLGQPSAASIGGPLIARSQLSSRPEVVAAAAALDRVYATNTAESAVDLAAVFSDFEAACLPCMVWPTLNDEDQPGGLLIQLSAWRNRGLGLDVDSTTATELRDVNERLLIASLKAVEQAEVQNSLRGQAEAALNLRDEFISIAAHELRTPVTGIKTSAQLALRALDDVAADRERTVRYLVGIVGGANRLVVLINDLMDVSRMRSGELLLRITPVDLGELLAEVALRYAEMAGDHHQVTTDVGNGRLIVDGDATRLEQVLDNLLSNSVKYSPAGGEIHVSLERALNGIVLTVSDRGIGLTPGAHERIFEPFGRAANARQQGLPGMGLGLHICRRIAEAHGGRMWAESPGEGQGMSVGMWLPPA